MSTGTVERDIQVRASERLRFSAWMATDQPTISTPISYAEVRIQNTRNGMFLDEDGEWVASEVAALRVENNDTMALQSITFRVQSIAESNHWTSFPLRITLEGLAGYFDDVSLLPAVNLAMVYGHNLGSVSPQLQYSDDGSSWTTLVTMRPVRPAFYGFADDDDQAYHLYWRILYEGTNHEPIYNGQAWIGYGEYVMFAQKWGWRDLDRWLQLEHTDPLGPSWRYPLGEGKVRGFELEFIPRTDEETGSDTDALEQLRKELWERSRAGVDPVIIIPMTDREAVAYGLLQASMSASHEFATYQTLSLSVEGYPPPTVGL